MSSSIPAAALATMPAGPPPPGVTPNLIDPPSENRIFFGVNTTIQVIMLAFLAFRARSKYMGFGRFGIDDYWCFVGAILTTFIYVEYAYIVTECKYGTHYWDISLALLTSRKFAIGTYLSTWPSNLAYLTIKNSFFWMYLSLFKPFLWMRVASYIGIFVNTGAYTAFTIVQLYAETPQPGTSWTASFSESKYTIAEHIAIPVSAIGLALDLYILLLPLSGIYRLRMDGRKKFGVMAVFSAGLGAVAASALGLYYRVRLTKNVATDLTWAVFPVYVVACAELQIGVICSCMPASAGLFRGNKHFLSNASSKVVSGIRRLLTLNSRTESRQASSAGSKPHDELSKHDNEVNLQSTYFLSTKSTVRGHEQEHELESLDGYNTRATDTNV